MKHILLFQFLLATTACLVSGTSNNNHNNNNKPPDNNDSDFNPFNDQPCPNTPTTRHCWGNHSINTNYYDTTPDTNHTVEIWLTAIEADCNPDGYRRRCLTFNGTVPGPLIEANWGDNLIIHVTNALTTNGTSIHWHGLRQWHTGAHDGVPGVTQCAIALGETQTYRFRVRQYGSTWYHSHFSLQYSEGLFGPMVLHGPASAAYDEDLGVLFVQDWSHQPVFAAWDGKQKFGMTHSMSNLLVNGTNTFDCAVYGNGDGEGKGDVNCVGGGKKFEVVFEPGKKYLLRLTNVALDSQFRFSIDGHKLKVIANDLVPIVPYETDSLSISAAQRYDIVVEANAEPGDYWMRAMWVDDCALVANDNPNSATAIVRYDTRSTADPTSTTNVTLPGTCADEPVESLVPYLPMDVTNIGGTTLENVNMRLTHEGVFQWTINSTSLRVLEGDDIFPTSYNIIPVDKQNPNITHEWAILIIQNLGAGVLGFVSHPVHMHGHDFWILAQVPNARWDTDPAGNSAAFNTVNPPRRDTAVLPAHGYLAIAFRLDNPGVWLVHCHIAWHASQGLALEIVERAGDVKLGKGDRDALEETCRGWDAFVGQEGGPPFEQGDSGI
ncbi:putative extracellular dihydrogeodin oxidase/laccase [Chaetomium sp. MPI-SDFR-AT-0129]|nr:putative extracellular dihydrogeodin oxidase/laccase [Chaetomium sp. MPI-SDFR-AT-0129]